jgi:hypothetical protein
MKHRLEQLQNRKTELELENKRIEAEIQKNG